jgi:hypothetical protein
MKKDKILIERNLKFNRKYIYLSLTRGNLIDGQVSCCDNCGKIISNMVEVRDNETGKRYTIGTDCADTLIQAKALYKGYSGGMETDYNLDIYRLNEATRFVAEIKAGQPYTVEEFGARLTDRKGKIKTIFRSQLEDFYPEYLQQQKTA